MAILIYCKVYRTNFKYPSGQSRLLAQLAVNKVNSRIHCTYHYTGWVSGTLATAEWLSQLEISPEICATAEGEAAHILDEPIHPVTVIKLLMVCLGKEGLLPEGSKGQETCQALAEMPKDG